MRDAAPTRSNVWLSGVLPSALALLVAALLLVERLQTDLAVADRSPIPHVWLSFLVAFGVAHIWGAAAVADDPARRNPTVARICRGVGFLAVHTPGLPLLSFGAYLTVLQGLVALPLILILGLDFKFQPYQQSLVFKLLLEWPLSALVLVIPGVAFGVMLAIAAAPGWRSRSRADWKRLILAYGFGSTIAMLILFQMNENVVSYYVRGNRNHTYASSSGDFGRMAR